MAIVIGGLNDVALDLVWIARAARRHFFVFRINDRATAETLRRPARPGRIAVFVAAWDEAEVIGPMLANAVQACAGSDATIYVGVYCNDAATIAAVSPYVSDRLRIVVSSRPGPTTKAECLNRIWSEMIFDEVEAGSQFKAIVLHDAEDVVHPDEMQVFACLTERFDLVQIPVVPLVDRSSRWVAGHYLDEFADHHGRTIVAREAIGAGLPSAGVGCAFSRDMLGRIAASRSGRPFDADSLTEDYELGLRIAEMGGRTIFVRLASCTGGSLVAVRAHFPGTLGAAVRQKARWMAGIALSGWDRLGWRGGLAERWMRLYDRRAILNAVVLIAAYCALVLNALVRFGVPDRGMEGTIGTCSPTTLALLRTCMALLVWRLAVRACLVARTYGWREGVRSVPRAFIANIIAMMAARRAVAIYLRARRDGCVSWDKTAHQFPTDLSTAR